MKPTQSLNASTVLKNIRTLRKEKKLSSQDVAQKLCISSQAYRSLESGLRTMTLDQFLHLAQILGVAIKDLVSEANFPTPHILQKAS